jgi:pyruvate kinase
MPRKAKIVATIGPASQDEETIQRLIQAGMSVARINFSHGTQNEHAVIIERIRRAAEKAGKAICILQDLQGPKIRTGSLPGGKKVLTAGDEVFLVTRTENLNSEKEIPVDFDELPACVVPQGRILLDDGTMELKVLETSPGTVRAKVVVGGILKSNKGINLPGACITIQSLTEKDRNDLAFGLQHGVDAVALSFVRKGQDILTIRDLITRLSPHKTKLPVIAKLERPEAVDNLEEIIHLADGVMVARGDLGVEMSPEEVPIVQKRIIACANRHGKLVVTATQMLDSMIHNPRPTRAEASDVANAILDGSDAVMLSGETAAGDYPVAAVEMMEAIICQAEAHMEEWGHWNLPNAREYEDDDSYYMTLAARELAHDRNVAAIAAFTESGRTAILMSKARPGVPILAFTPHHETYARLAMYWGVVPHIVPHVKTIKEMLIEVETAMMKARTIQVGQQVVLICGFPVDQVRPTNMALLHTIGS